MPSESRSSDIPTAVPQAAQRRPGWRAAAAIAALSAVIFVGGWWHTLRPENCFRRGRRALARGQTMTAGDRQTVIRDSRRLLGTPGYEPHGRLLSGLLFLHERRLLEALNELQHAARDRRTDVAALTAAAECYYLLGKYVQAVDAARAAVERDAEALDARRWLVAAYYDLGATGQAVEQLKIVAERAPHDPRPDRLLGLIDKDNERFGDAVGHYRESLRRDPNQPDQPLLLAELAESLVKLGRFDEARQVLPDCPRTATTLTLAAACEENLGRPDAAVEMLRDALDREPAYLPARIQLGSLLLLEGRVDEAVAVLEASVRAAPHSSQAHFRLSQAYGRRGERDRADEQLRLMRETQAVEREFTDLHEEAAKKPDDADLRYKIGLLARQLDKADLARLWFRAALAIEPGHAGARAALADDNAEPRGE
jgi:tetratricopeptide (TPR) repeat protein